MLATHSSFLFEIHISSANFYIEPRKFSGTNVNFKKKYVREYITSTPSEL